MKRDNVVDDLYNHEISRHEASQYLNKIDHELLIAYTKWLSKQSFDIYSSTMVDAFLSQYRNNIKIYENDSW